jgi:hypothetical protein
VAPSAESQGPASSSADRRIRLAGDSRLSSLSSSLLYAEDILDFTDNNPVVDPDLNPDPPDPHVFGPPGSGSISQRYGSGSGYRSGSFYHFSWKNSKKNLDSYYFVTLFDFLSWKNYVNVSSKNKQKFFIIISFLLTF